MAGNTRERILETALELFAQNGYLGTSMNDIAGQLGFTKAALYKHYGFRPNRNQSHAIAEANRKMQSHGSHYVVDVDIKGFFDNVSHGKLLKQLWALGIRDKKLLSILSTMLKAEVAGIGFPKAGVPQGGIISPLLSNVVLNEFDWWITSQWEEIPTRHAYTRYQKSNGV